MLRYMVKKNYSIFNGKYELHYKEILILFLFKGEKSTYLHRFIKKSTMTKNWLTNSLYYNIITKDYFFW